MIESPLTATARENVVPQRLADFATLTEALDYAASGVTGVNFYDSRARLAAAVPYRVVREQALSVAHSLHGLGLQRGDRVGLIAETAPEFMDVFYGCLYGGFVPVPLPVPVSLGGRDAYLERLGALLQSCAAAALIAPAEFVPCARQAVQELPLAFVGCRDELRAFEASTATLTPPAPDDIAYLQYTSGSVKFPRGVVVTHRAVMANLQGIVGPRGLGVRGDDRSISWLPFYHDMGLVGFVLGPMATQMSVDYLGPREFAMRPRQWLELISRNRGTIAFAPPLGYEICIRRVREHEVGRFDLSSWRIAGVGAEPVRAEVLRSFGAFFQAAGFDPRAFLPCYGLAESTLAVSFARRAVGVRSDCVDRRRLERDAVAEAAAGGGADVSAFVNCGAVMPGHELVIRDGTGRPLPERRVGRITVRGPSLMTGYFNDPAATGDVLDEDGWLDTGDLGYLSGGELFVTGRSKDLIIVNGRNIWPQDLEHLAETHSGGRPGDAVAFMVPGDPEPEVIMQVQCRSTDPGERARLEAMLANRARSTFGVHCRVELVPPRSLPRTSSGKLSRSEARRRFLQREQVPQHDARTAAGGGPA